MSSATAAATSPANRGSPPPAPNDAPVTNGTHVAAAAAAAAAPGVPALGTQEPRPPPAPPSAAATPNSKKAGAGKSKKPIDSTETSKLLATRIAQLEHDQAGDKDQAAEIGACLLSSDPQGAAEARDECAGDGLWFTFLDVGPGAGSCCRAAGRHKTAATCEVFGLQVAFT